MDLMMGTFCLMPKMHVLSETYQSLHIRKYTDSARLPEFPDPNCMPWYDHTRGLPRLPVEPSPTFSLQNPDLLPHAYFLYMARTTVRKPAALVFSPILGSPHEFFAMHEPPLRLQLEDARDVDFEDDTPGSAQPVYRRFYPLRCPVLDGDDPADDHWCPESLEGVWLGAHAAHRTEVLYIFCDRTAQAVRALKVTGDQGVPRGATSWQFALADRMCADELPHDPVQARELFGDLASVRLWRGTGTISGPGFLEHQRGTCTNYIGIVGRDEIRVNWFDVDAGDAPRYRRYRGRDLGSEISESLHLRLPAPWYRPQRA